MSSLYICYLSLLDPLTQTQVVAYLEGLARAGYRIILLTFEPRPLTAEETTEWRQRLAARGITWHWVRYHKRPTLPATAWDVAVGVAVGLRLIHRYQVSLVHARCHVPGLMALALKRLTGVKLLFDIRGFMAEEYVDAGNWPDAGLLFRATKRVERALVKAADALVVLTTPAEELLRHWYPREVQGKRIEVIPCCVDFQRTASLQSRNGKANGAGKERTLVYIGKLGSWYMEEAMVTFVAAAADMVPDLRWQVWTQSDPAALRSLLAERGLSSRASVGRLPPESVASALAEAHAGLSFIKPCLSKRSSSPTKVGEYLAAGLPVVSTAGIGDVDRLLNGPGECSPVGVLVRDLTTAGYRQAVAQLLTLLDDPTTPARCRAVAVEQLELEHVGWARYRQLYRDVLGG